MSSTLLQRDHGEDMRHSELEDAALVEAARADPAAFAALYHRYFDRVYRYLYHRVGVEADAEDLAGQTFIEVLESLERYKESGRFAAWLFTIARHKTITHYRQRRPKVSLDEISLLPNPQDDPLTEVAAAGKREKLARLLDRLHEDERELLELRFAGSLTYREIGAVLERSEAAVKMAIHRLLNQLRASWESES